MTYQSAAPTTVHATPRLVRLPVAVHYATRALIALAQTRADGPITCHAIADEARIPRGFLQGLLHQCQSAGLVRGIRGRAGGFVLAVPADQISIGRIMRAVLTSSHDRAPVACDTTALDAALGELNDAAIVRLDAMTIADLAAAPVLQAEVAASV